ncbi:unnamed protein product [Rotaria sordida]|uniref:Uncharacterized protein n=1 Tax=Rotaria sordida TaxID=392033 RepID=A0A815KTR9_9BILA|nr:unnamed protein product [Rotaria sordida]CAF4080996.1 unnamed protein product [Rotaria sordida]
MVDNETENSTYSYDYDYEEELIPSAKVQFWTYLMFGIPSLFCTIYLLYHLTFKRRLRRQLQNHVVMILLFLCLIILVIDNSFLLDGLRMGHRNSFPFSTNVCLLWWFIDYGFYGCGLYPCYQDIPWTNTWDYFLNGILCNILEAFFTISLVFRTIWRKCISTRYFHWKKYRKMIIQLFSISILSLSINFPQALITFVQTQPNMSHFGSTVAPYFFYLTTYVVLFLPIVCFVSLPELWPQKFFFYQRRQGAVAPMIIAA